MYRQPDCIWLVDDDEPTNYLNTMILEEAGFDGRIVALQRGEEALRHLRSEEEGAFPSPDLILLDLNMPGMDGWEFLDACRQSGAFAHGRPVIVILTTSLNPDEEDRARRLDEIDDFRQKPLTPEVLTELLHRHFPGVSGDAP